MLLASCLLVASYVCYQFPIIVTSFLGLLPVYYICYQFLMIVTSFLGLLPVSYDCYQFPMIVTSFLCLLLASCVCYQFPMIVTRFLGLLPVSYVCNQFPTIVTNFTIMSVTNTVLHCTNFMSIASVIYYILLAPRCYQFHMYIAIVICLLPVSHVCYHDYTILTSFMFIYSFYIYPVIHKPNLG